MPGEFNPLARAQARGSGGNPAAHVAFTQESRRIEVERDYPHVPDRYDYGNWQHVNSSWIQSLRYNSVGNFAQMMVRKGSKIYTFGGMMFATFYMWFNAPSKGKYFNAKLKGHYRR